MAGRKAEHETIAAVLGSVERSRAAQSIEVVGEAGIGKTTLLGSLAAADLNWLTLEGRAAEYERDRPFAVFVDALDDYLAGLPDGQVQRIGADRIRELAAVFPAMETLANGRADVLDSERFRLYRAVRSLLERLAGERPLVLVLDDLHWADAASCELIASLLRRPPDAAVLLALAYRSGRAPAILSGQLASSASEGRLTHVELGPLSRAEAAGMTAGVTGAAQRERLYVQSGGNPFYLEQLVRSALRHVPAGSMGLVGRGAGVALEGEVPPLVARALAGEVAALSGTAQAALQAAAVAGEPFDPDVIAQIAGVPESAALVALDELLDRDLVRETAVPRRFRFRHPLVRHAVYGSITGGCRLRAHARAGSVLAARGAGAVACAPHVEQSAGVGDEDAIALLAAAGAATAGRAPASSARWWEAALRLVPEYGPGSERAAQMRPQVAKALASAGRVNDAYATLLTALELVDAGDERASVPLIVACAGLESLIGEHERALGRLLAARAPVGDHSREAVTIELELAMYGAYLADLELLCEAAQRAQDGARVSGEAGLVASAMVMQAVARNFGGQRGPATSASEEAARLLAKLDDDELADRMGVVFFLAWAEWELGLLAVCDDRMEHAIALARSSGRADWLPHLTFSRTIAVIWLGKLDEARVVSQESVEAAEVNGDPYTRMQSQCATCLTLTAIGELEAAVRAGQQSVAIARTLSPSQYTASAGWACAWALVELGQPQRGIDVMFEMLGGPGLEAVFLGWRSYCYEALTRAELALGNQAQAEQWATLAASCAEEFGVAFAHACADRAAAETLLAAGAPAAAVVRAERAAAHADLMGARLDVARARLLAGRAYAAEGNRERAAEHLRSAELEFAACGALRLRDQTVRELRRIGLRVSRAGRRGGADARAGGVPSLSGREHEIATLVRDRKTNREIAGQLFLSEKTIESHMRNIFVKLGVDARAEVARRLERVES